MLLSKVLSNIKCFDVYDDRDVSFITDDSKKVAPGCVFVCIEGAHFDSHTIAGQMLEKGAVAVVVSRDLGLKNQIIVKNTREAYTLMSMAFFNNDVKKLKLIGVTGTNGKTTTTMLIKSILEKLGKKVGLVGTVVNCTGDKTYESHLTTPEPFELHSLFSEMVENTCEYCVMECSSQALALGRLAGLEFETGIFTNLTQDHLDFHKTFENYANAKKMLFNASKTCIINLDDERALSMVSDTNGRLVTYSSENLQSDYRATDVQYFNDSVKYLLETKNGSFDVKVKIPGEFTVYNSLAAAVGVIELGFDVKQVLFVLSLCKGVKGRIEVADIDAPFTVIFDYAHSPDGLENIISSLRKTATGRIITVFGCGGDRDRTKRPIMGEIATRLSNFAVVTSDNPRTEEPDEIIKEILVGIKTDNYIVEPDRTTAIFKALDMAKAGDTVLLAGKGHETYQILGKEKIHFDEREKVKQYFDNKK